MSVILEYYGWVVLESRKYKDLPYVVMREGNEHAAFREMDIAFCHVCGNIMQALSVNQHAVITVYRRQDMGRLGVVTDLLNLMCALTGKRVDLRCEEEAPN